MLRQVAAGAAMADDEGAFARERLLLGQSRLRQDGADGRDGE